MLAKCSHYLNEKFFRFKSHLIDVPLLPRDILITIYSYLSKDSHTIFKNLTTISQVCKHWREALEEFLDVNESRDITIWTFSFYHHLQTFNGTNFSGLLRLLQMPLIQTHLQEIFDRQSAHILNSKYFQKHRFQIGYTNPQKYSLEGFMDDLTLIFRQLFKNTEVDRDFPNYSIKLIDQATYKFEMIILKCFICTNDQFNIQFSKNQYAALLVAFRHDHLDMVKQLLENHWENKMISWSYLINDIAVHNSFKTFKYLLNSPRFNFEHCEFEALFTSIRLHMVTHLLNHEKYTSDLIVRHFYYVCKYEHISILPLFLSHPKLNLLTISYPKLFECLNKKSEILTLLLNHPDFQKGIVSNENFHSACQNGLTSIVKILLQNPKIDPSIIDPIYMIGNKALYIAVRYNQVKVVKILLKDKRVITPVSKFEIYRECERSKKRLQKHFRNLLPIT